jgi:hypothetical protein
LVLFNYCFKRLNHLICGHDVKYQASTGQEFLFATSATITVGVKHLAKAEAARLNLRPSSPLPLVMLMRQGPLRRHCPRMPLQT